MHTRLAGDVEALKTARQQATGRRCSALHWVLSVGSMLAIFGYIFWEQVPIDSVAREILSANPWWLFVAVVVTVAHRFLMALKWWVILRGEGARLGAGEDLLFVREEPGGRRLCALGADRPSG